MDFGVIIQHVLVLYCTFTITSSLVFNVNSTFILPYLCYVFNFINVIQGLSCKDLKMYQSVSQLSHFPVNWLGMQNHDQQI